MEIAKFVITCILAAITISGTFAGIWHAYSKKMTEKIEKTKTDAANKIATVEKEMTEKVHAAESTAKENDEKIRRELEKQIEKLDDSVADLQETINSDIRDRLGNIEGEMKGMSNILKSIQNWFISNTPNK